MKKQPAALLSTLKNCTDFEFKVYKKVFYLAPGEVRSYKEIASSIGHPGAYRAVGRALKHNPYPFIIPCHRVIKSDGSPGGYVFGKRMKKRLLKLEQEFLKDCF